MAKRRVAKRPHTRRKLSRARRRSRSSHVPIAAADKLTKGAIRNLLKALADVARHNERAIEGFEAIRSSAADRREGELVAAALQDHLLDDLVALDRILSASRSSDNDGLVRLRAVPAAVLRWAATNMKVEPILSVGEEREVPVAVLERYDCDETPGFVSGRLVTVRALTTGWKWRGKELVKPRVAIS